MFANIHYLLFDTPPPPLINVVYLFFTYVFIVNTMSFIFNSFFLDIDPIYNADYDADYDDDDEDDDDYEDDDDDDDDDEDEYKYYDPKCDKISPKVKDPPPPPPVKINYQDKYVDKFKKLDAKYLKWGDLMSLKNSFVFETTPIGRVIMSYNHDEDPDLCHFYYYSNTIIPYKILDIVAQKYVITFDCKILYIDVFTELDNLKKKVIENHKKINDELTILKEKDAENTQQNKLFATFKKYNTTSTNIQIKEDNSKLVIKEKINKYINKGKITNFEFIKKVDKKLVSKNYSLKFSDFKKLNL